MSSGWKSDILMPLDKMCPFPFGVARLVGSKLEMALGNFVTHWGTLPGKGANIMEAELMDRFI